MARGMHTLCRVSIQAGYEVVNVREWEMPDVHASTWPAGNSAETGNCQEQEGFLLGEDSVFCMRRLFRFFLEFLCFCNRKDCKKTYFYTTLLPCCTGKNL